LELRKSRIHDAGAKDMLSIVPPRGGLNKIRMNTGYKHAAPLALEDRPSARQSRIGSMGTQVCAPMG
jgi:hypothetical protein